jgi:hypothetical protein
MIKNYENTNMSENKIFLCYKLRKYYILASDFVSNVSKTFACQV